MAIIEREEQFYDVRLVKRLIKKGLVKQKDYEKYLKSLPDVENEGELIPDENISLEDVPTECQKQEPEEPFDSEDMENIEE